nr:synaptotagmin-4-like isoform X1 [Ipomoea batatas]
MELKPQAKVTITIIRASNLKNREVIGKSDPYVVVYIRSLFKVKTKTIDDNLNPVWNETFELIAEDKETQAVILEVFDEDVGQDELMGVAKLPLNELVPETSKQIELRLLPKLDMFKVKDKKDRGTITIKVLYHEFSKQEQLAAVEDENKTLEARKKLREEGAIGSARDAVDGAASAVGSGISAGAEVVGSGISAGVGSGKGAVTSGLSKAGKFVGRTFTGHSISIHSKSHRRDNSPSMNSAHETGGGGGGGSGDAKPV